VIALIPNKESDTNKDIEKLYRKLIEEIAPQLYLHILSLELDSAITEFQAQQSILNTQTSKKLTFSYELSESLGMIQPVDLFINRNNLLTISLHKDEVSTSYIYNNTNLADIYEIDDISSAISSALKEKVKLKAPSTIKINIISSVLPNKASHLTVYFTKNENSEQQFIKQREKCWKENQKNMLMTLAQLYFEEIEKSKKINLKQKKYSIKFNFNHKNIKKTLENKQQNSSKMMMQSYQSNKIQMPNNI
ncbi:4528_t:CDS:2, partial [Cetraspora pellucida]